MGLRKPSSTAKFNVKSYEMKLAKRKITSRRKPAPQAEDEENEVVEIAAEVPDIEVAESLDESTRELELNELQRTLANCELRIRDIDVSLQAEIDRQVSLALAKIEQGVYRMEEHIVQKIFNFIQAAPLWEVMKVTKTNVGPSDFYSPYEYMRKLLAQGWKYFGNYYDENSKERYDMLMRPKDMPTNWDAVLKLYEQYGKTNKPGEAALADVKKAAAKTRAAKLKTLGYDAEGKPLVKAAAPTPKLKLKNQK